MAIGCCCCCRCVIERSEFTGNGGARLSAETEFDPWGADDETGRVLAFVSNIVDISGDDSEPGDESAASSSLQVRSILIPTPLLRSPRFFRCVLMCLLR